MKNELQHVTRLMSSKCSIGNQQLEKGSEPASHNGMSARGDALTQPSSIETPLCRSCGALAPVVGD